MNIRLAYGKTGLDVTLPDGLQVDVVGPSTSQALAGPGRSRAGRSAQSHRLTAVAGVGQAVATPSASSATTSPAPTPYQTILPVLLEELGHVPDDAITLLDCHRDPQAQHAGGTQDDARRADRRQIPHRAE